MARAEHARWEVIGGLCLLECRGEQPDRRQVHGPAEQRRELVGQGPVPRVGLPEGPQRRAMRRSGTPAPASIGAGSRGSMTGND